MGAAAKHPTLCVVQCTSLLCAKSGRRTGWVAASCVRRISEPGGPRCPLGSTTASRTSLSSGAGRALLVRYAVCRRTGLRARCLFSVRQRDRRTDWRGRREYRWKCQIRVGGARRLSWPEQLLKGGCERRFLQLEKNLGLQAFRRVRRCQTVRNLS